MFKNLKLRNYKCFSECEWNLEKLTLLSGINSGGKSSVIQGLLLCAEANEMGKREGVIDLLNVNQLELLESTNFKGILLGDEEFEFGTSIACLDDKHGIRGIKNIPSLKQFLVLLTNNTKTSSEFIDILRRTLDGLEFDAEIEHSIKTLEAGFEIRKKEVLYHLFCIEREIPMILKCYKGNQEIGAHMSLPCSPERDRNLVKKKLTKKIGDTELVCELHTKLKKIGSRKPDRIYFCPQVKSHIVNKNGEDITGKIYIYKIGEHL